MKNLNRYKDIFSSKENLSAEDIEQYNSLSQQEKNAIEQKEMSDSFDQEAMEGWESISYDTSILTNKKNPFSTRPNTGLYIIIGSVVIGIVISMIFLVNNSKENEGIRELFYAEKTVSKEIIIESSEIILPKEIEELKQQPLVEQKLVTEIKSDFNGIEEINIQLTVEKPHQIENDQSSGIIHNKTKGEEIYLQDLKLLNYSTYRSTSTIETKQFVLTGTPADLEEENNDSFETEWKTIQQPYPIYLENSMYYFNNGEYKKALYRFETILKKYPEDVNANFYSGLCFFNFGEYSQAIQRFSKCTQGNFNNFDEESKWMIANSYKNLGQKVKATDIYKEIVKLNGFYSTQAMKELLK